MMAKNRTMLRTASILTSVLGLSLVTTFVLASAAPVGASAPSQASAQDPLFTQPYIDVDEWRDTPVRHRYVHGGFRGTETRFSFYLPPKEIYQGRFFQHLTPSPDNEYLAQHLPLGEENKIGFAIASGGYFIETNGGGASVSGYGSADPTIGAFRANAAAATYSRAVALAMYGGKRPYGYAFGGSGGAYRTIGSFENTRGVWDGAVPYVLGSFMAIPNGFTVRMHAMRILRDKFPQIVDAVEPGGSGDPYAGLTDEQAAALHEVTRMGFPIQSWFGWRTMGIHGFAALYGGMLQADPTYFTDFWTKPGYLGFDHPESFAGQRMQHVSRITKVIHAKEAAALGLNTSVVNGTVNGGVDNAFGALQGSGGDRVVAYRLAAAPPAMQFLGGDLFAQSGKAIGKRLTLNRVAGDVVILGVADQALAAQFAVGDEVRADNSNFLAAQTYHRHQVPPGTEFPEWDQFRGSDGKPLYPQRPMLLGPIFTKATAGSLLDANFDGKMILLESLWDREAFPWQGDWYRKRVQARFGAQADQHFRLWYVDHALHGDMTKQEDPTHTVSYLGVLQQALRDLVIWVEQGTPPPATTAYTIDDGQVRVADKASSRKGLQPVVTLSAGAGRRVKVRAGMPVRLNGRIETPPGGGKVVAADWDFDGSGQFTKHSQVRPGQSAISVSIDHAFDAPGTYFAVLRATAQRESARGSPYAHLQNLDRTRIEVVK
jgi:hypothetical protein